MMKKIYYYGLPLLLGIPGILLWLRPGFLLVDDSGWMVIRLSAFFETLRGGEFPVRFVARLANGYGYPVADFLYPLYLYVGSVIHLFGISFVNDVKLLFIGSFMLSGLFCFLWLRQRYSYLFALSGSLFYMYFPYHLWDMNVRGSLGEMVSFAILPFVLWQIERKNVWWMSLGIACMFLAHNTLAVLLLPCILLYGIFSPFRFTSLVTSFIFGIGLSAFFIIPAILDQNATQFPLIRVADSAAFLLNTQAFLALSAVMIMLVCLGLKKRSHAFVVWVGMSWLVLFLIYPGSSFLWSEHLLLRYIQFPMRFLSVLMLSVTIMFVTLLSWIEKKWLFAFLLIVSIPLIGSYLWVMPIDKIQQLPDGFFTTNESTTTTRDEYLPIWAPTIPSHEAIPDVMIATGAASIAAYTQRGNTISFTVKATQPSVLVIHRFYYPGWQVQTDNHFPTQDILANRQGLVLFGVPAGEHMVKVSMKETNGQLVSDAVSVLSLLGLVVYTVYRRKKSSLSTSSRA